MRRVAAGGYRRRAAAGVGFLYFSLIALPVLFFGAGLATDFTRIIIAGRQVSNAAQAAALAGAQQFKPDANQLDPQLAQIMAVETYCYAQGAGQLSLSSPSGATSECTPLPGAVSVDVTPVSSGFYGGEPVYTMVDVTARYEVGGLLFTNLFGVGNSYVPGPLTRSAAVCIPGVAGPTGGHCVHPTY